MKQSDKESLNRAYIFEVQLKGLIFMKPYRVLLMNSLEVYDTQLSESAKRRIVLFLSWLLGVTFTVAASLKAIGIESFSQQIARYNLAPSNFALPLAISVILLEAFLGISCIIGFYPPKALWGMVILLGLFVSATVFRWDLLQGTNCRCLGDFIVGGPKSVLWHNGLLILLAGSLIAIMRRTTIQWHSLRWLRTAAGVVAVITAMFIARPLSVKTSLAPPSEDEVRIFLSTTCKHCQESAGKVRELVNGSEMPPVRVFIGAQYQQQINDFLKNGNLDVDYIPLTFSQLAHQAEHVPTVRVFHGGKVVKEWIGDVPSLEEVRQSLWAIPNSTEYRD